MQRSFFVKKFLTKLPLPICGLILGLVSTGNLVKSEGFTVLGNVFGWIGIVLLVVVVLKIVFANQSVRQALNDPIQTSVAPTFTMALMVTCTYLTDFSAIGAYVQYLWLLAVVLHFVIMAYFTVRFVILADKKIQIVFPSWFIMYVGIGVMPVTCGAFFPAFGQFMLWPAVVLYLIVLPFVIRRIFFVKDLPEAAQPLITILAAPGSLVLTGYLKAFTHINWIFLLALFCLSQFLYFVVLYKLPTLLKTPFYPSYGAFTFPLIISSMAMSSFKKFLTGLGFDYSILLLFEILEFLIAIAIVTYVLIRYLHFMFRRTEKIPDTISR